jgi:hypothetical protein
MCTCEVYSPCLTSYWLTLQEENVKRDAEERIAGYEKKLAGAEAGATSIIAELRTSIAEKKAMIGAAAVEADAAVAEFTQHLKTLKADYKEAILYIAEEEASSKAAQDAVKKANSTRKAAEAELTRRQAEVQRLRAAGKRDVQSLDQDREALGEASHVETKVLFQKFEAQVAKYEEGQMEKLRREKMAEAEASLARRRKTQRWVAERRKRAELDVHEVRSEVDKSERLEQKVLAEVQQVMNFSQWLTSHWSHGENILSG